MTEENKEIKQEDIKILLNSQYLKDLSFESPNAPHSIPKIAKNPKIDFTVDINANHFGKNNFEVVLNITATATEPNEEEPKEGEKKDKNKTIFITEIQYAGLFKVEAPEDHIKPILLIDCPTLIFPFARRIIADVTRDGGFPPLMMEPINFYHLYMQNQKKEDHKVN